MHIDRILVSNFRLLQNVELSLEKKTTLIVGRNNSGKTSLTELFRRLLSDSSPSFCLEDFSLSVHENFWQAYELFNKEDEKVDIREKLPVIEVRIFIDYSDSKEFYGPLGEFIIDLNPKCTTAIAVLRYELQDGKLQAFFGKIGEEKAFSSEEGKTGFFKAVKKHLSKFYGATIYAEDPNDPTNRKILEPNKLRSLLQSGFINAQRGLDDATRKDGADQKKNNVLGSILEQLFTTTANSDKENDQKVIANLEGAVRTIQQGLQDGFSSQLAGLLPTFSLFGYPGLSDPELCTETTLDVERLLKNNTKVYYAGVNGVNLPEAYNGLGTRNLIYILLQLLEFYKDFASKAQAPTMHLVFIEEPEAHLHPQMQEVFTAKIGEIADTFSKTFGTNWPVQFVVTTHSPHMANKAPFEAMRYFTSCFIDGNANMRATQIKDLRGSLTSTPQPDQEFLHKYMVLTGCDLLFADKIVLIEGPTERIMLPEIIRKSEADTTSQRKLSCQYVSIMEVGGAHAHKFFELLAFLNLRTLIITDMDSTDENSEACPVADGRGTSNSCIKAWFSPDVSPQQLLAKSENDKIKGCIRLAYQIPEQGQNACGRSFEDAFLLANFSKFGLTAQDDKAAFDKAQKIKKTNFAIEHGINDTNWEVPLYLSQGLQWLGGTEVITCKQDNSDPKSMEAA